MVSPTRTTTAPLACLARWPVSIDNGRPATSTSTLAVLPRGEGSSGVTAPSSFSPASLWAPPAWGCSVLPPQAEPIDNRAVPLHRVRAEVDEEAPPLADHPQQSPAGMKVVLVRAQMVAQVIDAGGQAGDLHVRRPGILRVPLKLVHGHRPRRLVSKFHPAPTSCARPPGHARRGRDAAGAADVPAAIRHFILSYVFQPAQTKIGRGSVQCFV